MGIGNNELIEFEEQNSEELIEQFLQEHAEEWAEFVMEQYSDSLASIGDSLLDAQKEEGLL